jgi:ABC-type Na+ efflux pump permease subunit
VPLHSFAGSNVFKDSNLFNEIGVRTIINATGKLTYMSGSLMHPDVVKTIREASNHFCMMVIIISLMVHPIFVKHQVALDLILKYFLIEIQCRDILIMVNYISLKHLKIQSQRMVLN